MVNFKGKSSRFFIPLSFLFLSLPNLSVTAQTLEAAKIFSSNMVLQRDVPLPVWGNTAADELVTVFFNGKAYETRSKQDGSWQVSLPRQATGGPFEMSVVSASGNLDYKNIMIGDVWLCSGQSNMEWTVANSNNPEQEIKEGTHPKIRHFKVPRSASYLPEHTLVGGSWEVSSPETVGDFTAVGYYFAKEIQASENIPIGLLNSSWGGSRIEPWIRAEDLGFENPEEMANKQKAEQEAEKAALMAFFKKRLGTIPEKDLGMDDEVAVWAAKDHDDSNWESMDLPILWEQAGWEKTDGVFWFRKKVILPKGMSASNAVLSLGPIDDNDDTWVNGHRVGGMKVYNKNRVYTVPAKYLKEGSNTITIRVEDTGGGGGIYGDPALMFFENNKSKVALKGPWKYKVGRIQMNANTGGENQQPTLLYNKMIHPILKFPIRGVLWYQGESNAGNLTDAKGYTAHFQTLIKSWRSLWNVGDFPFLYVQLANFMAVKDRPAPSNWALLRESQSNALELPNTGQAVIIDIGEANDIHPRNKQDVGKRLALAAKKLSYGKELVFSGPTYAGMTKSNNKITLRFENTGDGLRTKDGGPLKGFAIAGKDKKFVWANARIVNNTVEVWSNKIDQATAVRYAWADNPEAANLYNKEGLPASPFRTDHWEE
ncbi:MAG: sialate O-acetylesterase [Flavobacteriaceae bacterium]